ncbi:MAG: cytochrome-c oxidase, cbb3-type subunit II, partial [Myxococcaceae bacterium]
LAHYTDWIVGHVHSGALGWNGFMAAGMFYWLVPRLYGRELYSRAAADFHFWIATFGIILYVIAMWVSGITQGLMWRALTPEGSLLYPNFVETIIAIRPMYWMRLVGGSLYLIGFIIMIWNLGLTMIRGKAVETTVTVLEEDFQETRSESSVIFSPAAILLILAVFAGLAFFYVSLIFAAILLVVMVALGFASWLSNSPNGKYHRLLEGRPVMFTWFVVIAILVGGLAELVPTVLGETKAVDGKWPIRPYTALELHGRDIYVREGCYNCHSQMIRPFRDEEMRYGAAGKIEDYIFDRPFQWGSKRTGPDLQRVGKKYPDIWHYHHMRDPRTISAGSNMPTYPWLLEQKIDFASSSAKLGAMQFLGVPYTKADVLDAQATAENDAKLLTSNLEEAGVKTSYDAEIVALIAYLQSLGTR